MSTKQIKSKALRAAKIQYATLDTDITRDNSWIVFPACVISLAIFVSVMMNIY